MKIIDKVFKTAVIVFMIGFLIAGGIAFLDFQLSSQFISIIKIGYAIVAGAAAVTGIILSINSMLKYFKKDSSKFIKTFFIRFIILFIIFVLINYIKDKEIAFLTEFITSISLTFLSFYLYEDNPLMQK